MTTSTTTKCYNFNAETLEKIAMKEVLKDLEHSNGLQSPISKSINIWWDNKDMHVDVVIEVVK